MTKPTTVIKKTTDEIKCGEFPIDKEIGLVKLHFIKVSSSRNSINKYGKKTYHITAKATHPYFEDITFSFNYTPQDGKSFNFKNAHGDNICQGETPRGEIKDVVIAALMHESYAFQISIKRTTWVHAENNPNDGHYLLWHVQYYGKYSPRNKWKLPKKCEAESLWKKHKCKLCEGTRCPYAKTLCPKCKAEATYICPVCKAPSCLNHSHCINGHYILSSSGMYEGVCKRCRRKTLLGQIPCQCGSDEFDRY